MRIISGERRGLKLISPKDEKTRPTEDRIKESVFNIIGYIAEDSIVLDACSGTGSIGLEFLSRGAKSAYLVENNRQSVKVIKDNIAKSKYEDKANLINGDIVSTLDKLSKKNISFDYIYIDPPYDRVDIYESVLDSIHKHNMLKENGLIILETVEGTDISNIKLYEIVDTRKYRSTKLIFLNGEK
ncbi:MAG: 16S rRNA (guanine(966)-N(2))-methyltransferase RsmD [Tissierellia bacterium]|nr:16S rRNA (guanine(966)-N(2))-methyltransferase RsmD [Tissierellia bacterium]